MDNRDDVLEVMKFDRRKILGLAGGTVAATMFGPLGLAGTPNVSAHALASYNQSAGFGTIAADTKSKTTRGSISPGSRVRTTSPFRRGAMSLRPKMVVA